MLENIFVDPVFLEACLAHRGRRYEDALEGYTAVLARRPSHAFAMLNRCFAEAVGKEGGTTLPELAKAVDLIGDEFDPYLATPLLSFLRTPRILRMLGNGLVDFGVPSAGRRLLRAAVACQSTSGLTLQMSAEAFDGSIWTEMSKDGTLDKVLDPDTPMQPRSADDWYRIGAQYFLKSQLTKASRAFRAMAEYDPRAAAIFKPSSLVGKASAELRPDQRTVITHLLEHHAEAEARGRLPTPVHVQRPGGRPASTIPFDQVTMLSVLTEWVGCKPDSLPSYMAEMLHGTASRLGIRSHFFAGDPVLYNGLSRYNPDEMKECLDRLADAYATVKPDVFLFDASYRPLSNTIDHDFLERVIDRKRTRIVAVVGDAWWGNSAHWEAIVDVVVTFDPLVTNEALLHSPYPERILPIFHPLDEQRFFELPPGGAVDHHALFVGSIANTPAMMRMPWIAALADARIPISIHDGNRQVDKALSHEAYAMAIRKAAMTYSFSGRNRNRSTIIGRQWEAIQSGTLLLEEGGSPLNEFFQPFWHYVPFENVAEALAFTHYFLENRAARDDIANRAMSFRREHYSTRRFWELILESALGPTMRIRQQAA